MFRNVSEHLKICLRTCRRNDTVETLHRHLADWLWENQSDLGGQPMISVTQLSEELGVARQTLQKVYDLLEQEKLIFRGEKKRHWIVQPIRRFDRPVIAVILPAPFSDYYRCSFEYGERHFGVYTGLMDRAMELRYALVPLQLPGADAAGEEIASVAENLGKHYAGVVHLGGRGLKSDPPLAAVLALPETPQVSIDCIFPGTKVFPVTFDPAYVANVIAAYLQENGHKNIGIVCNYLSESDAFPLCRYVINSQESIIREFQPYEKRFRKIFYVTTDRQRFGPRFEQRIREILAVPEPPTAFWCRDDLSAMETIRVIRSYGFRVPLDISVIGFDDLERAALFDPPLTTLRNPVYELGYAAITRLDELIRKVRHFSEVALCLPPVLCVRQSSLPRKDFRINH